MDVVGAVTMAVGIIAFVIALVIGAYIVGSFQDTLDVSALPTTAQTSINSTFDTGYDLLDITTVGGYVMVFAFFIGALLAAVYVMRRE